MLEKLRDVLLVWLLSCVSAPVHVGLYARGANIWEHPGELVAIAVAGLVLLAVIAVLRHAIGWDDA